MSREDPLEEGIAPHSSILVWRIPRTEKPGELQAIGPQSWTWLKWLHTHAHAMWGGFIQLANLESWDARSPQWCQSIETPPSFSAFWPCLVLDGSEATATGLKEEQENQVGRERHVTWASSLIVDFLPATRRLVTLNQICNFSQTCSWLNGDCVMWLKVTIAQNVFTVWEGLKKSAWVFPLCQGIKRKGHWEMKRELLYSKSAFVQSKSYINSQNM